MKSPDLKSSAWKDTGAFAERHRSAFRHVNRAESRPVTSCQKSDGAESGSRCKLPSGTIPREVWSGVRKEKAEASGIT